MYRVSWHLNRFHGIQINEAAKKEKLSYVFRSKEERTTDTEDRAIAADAIQGLRERPHGTKMPKKEPIKYNVHVFSTSRQDALLREL